MEVYLSPSLWDKACFSYCLLRPMSLADKSFTNEKTTKKISDRVLKQQQYRIMTTGLDDDDKRRIIGDRYVERKNYTR